jgi:hypothetical protein
MSTLILLVFLTGAVLGLRFKVLILAPAIGLALIVVVAMAIARGDGVASILLAGALASVCLQVGYLGGILTRYTMTLARVRSRTRRDSKASLQAESAH